MPYPPDSRTRIFFINSEVGIGADTATHLQLLRNLPKSRLELHAAGQPGSPLLLGLTSASAAARANSSTSRATAMSASRVDRPADSLSPTFRGSWESDAFTRLLRNTVAWATH